MSMNDLNKKYDLARKFKEYEMKITKMAGYLSDYYIDRAMESDDFSEISSFLIDYFSGSAGRSFDIGYLVTKYNDFGLNKKIEDMDFDINEWYKIKYEIDKPINYEYEDTKDLNDEDYIQYMIEKRKKEQE